MPDRVFIDTNIVLEFKPLKDWDWNKLNLSHPQVYVSAPVIRELDKLKNSRTRTKAERAKKFLKLLDEVPAKEKALQQKGFCLVIMLSEPPIHIAEQYQMSLQSEDERILAAAMYKVQHNKGTGTNYLLSADQLVRLRAKHIPGSQLVPLEPPKEYRITEEAPDVAHPELIAREIFRLLKAQINQDLVAKKPPTPRKPQSNKTG